MGTTQPICALRKGIYKFTMNKSNVIIFNVVANNHKGKLDELLSCSRTKRVKN